MHNERQLQDQQMAMYLVLPIQRFMLNEVETKLNAEKLESLIGRMQETNVDVRLPKFRISQKFRLKVTTATRECLDYLTSLSSSQCFTINRSD